MYMVLLVSIERLVEAGRFVSINVSMDSTIIARVLGFMDTYAPKLIRNMVTCAEMSALMAGNRRG